MTRQSLAAAASLLYGSRWQRPLARYLGIDSRLVRRWKAGDRPIPAWVEPVLLTALKARTGDIEALIKEYGQ